MNRFNRTAIISNCDGNLPTPENFYSNEYAFIFILGNLIPKLLKNNSIYGKNWIERIFKDWADALNKNNPSCKIILAINNDEKEMFSKTVGLENVYLPNYNDESTLILIKNSTASLIFDNDNDESIIRILLKNSDVSNKEIEDVDWAIYYDENSQKERFTIEENTNSKTNMINLNIKNTENFYNIYV